MPTLNRPQQARAPLSADRHHDKQDLAVLTRVNHDMRSPLSVILGVFELMEDSSRLSDSERRYLKLGTKAADELLTLADAMRLYSAMERNLVTVDAIPVELGALVTGQIESTLEAKGVSIGVAPSVDAGAPALGDPGYLSLALSSLVRHLTAHLPEVGRGSHPALEICQELDEQGRTRVRISSLSSSAAAATPSESTPAEEDDLGVLNAVRLIEMMGGSVLLGAGNASLEISLPTARTSAA